ncbi:MAG: hypothetical protein IKN69_04835 [Bacilli bacterium]|nr:hypothetical protein [Bacilli bacterium]MBR6865783.1 hypothetical protein [Bacilli bacterium]
MAEKKRKPNETMSYVMSLVGYKKENVHCLGHFGDLQRHTRDRALGSSNAKIKRYVTDC